MTNTIKLSKALENGNEFLLSDDINAKLVLGEFEDYKQVPSELNYDKLKDGDEVHATFIIKNKFGIEIDRWTAAPYVFGGVDAHEKNINRQSDALNNIKKQLDELIKAKIELNDQHYLKLKNVINNPESVKKKSPQVWHVIKHEEKFPLSYGFTVQVVYSSYLNHDRTVDTFRNFIIRDDDGKIVTEIFGDCSFVSGKKNDSQNIKSQNERLASINEGIEYHINGKMNYLNFENERLKRDLNNLNER